jgi:PilZ domain
MQVSHHSRMDASSQPQVRRFPRTLYSAPITLHGLATGVLRTCHGISLDLSEGGVGALVSGGPRVGETVQIELQLRECLLCADAVVVHSSGVRSGFQFLGLKAEEKSQIGGMVGSG